MHDEASPLSIARTRDQHWSPGRFADAANRLAEAQAPVRVCNSHFAGNDCLNCGAALTGTYCSACGQKKAARIGGSTVRKEAWSRFRWFELDALKSAWRLIRSPGAFARDYVMGKRSAQMHPVGLLLLMIGVLVLLLGETQYLMPTLASEEAQRMFALVRDYSKWSFSLGIIAIYASAMLVFRKRLGYNATEILALAIYVHAVCIALQIVNQLPLLVWRAPELLQWHRKWSPWFMGVAQALIVVFAFRQFFRLDGLRQTALLLLAGALFIAGKWGVQQLFARAVVEIVHWQMGL
jgi:hypothetical protein